MNRRQKSTLRGQHIRIADELILDEDLFAALRRDKIFTQGMIDIIKNESKPRDRVYKMLELLEKRGPNAFDKFINILKENYDWLAELLEEEYEKRMQQDCSSHTKMAQAHQETQQPELRSMLTPIPKHRKHRQVTTEGIVSASQADKDTQNYFGTQMMYSQSNLSNDVFDAPQAITVSLTNVNDDNEKPKYKDACMSPINVLESARKPAANADDVDEIDGGMPDGSEQLQDNSKDTSEDTYIPKKPTDEVDSAYSATDEAQSQMTEETRVSSLGYHRNNVEPATDEVDGPTHLESESGVTDDGFPSGEIYYECVRRGSSCMPSEIAELYPDNDNNNSDDTGTEISGDHILYVPYQETEAYLENQEAMKALYIKLTEAASDHVDTDDDYDEDVNWETINEAADKLIDRLQNSDDMKMIRRCYGLFPEKERRRALNICIQSLLDSKKEVDNQLRNKKKEIDDMVYDLWKHQQDISNIKRIRKNLADLEMENKNLKCSLENLEKDFEKRMKVVEEKDARILDLESKLKENEPRRAGAGANQRRGGQNQRQRTIIAQPLRRQSSQYPLGAESPMRVSTMQSGYGNQSPRLQNPTGRRPGNSRR